MQIAILNGIYGKDTPDLARSYPINMVPVVTDTGINKGYLRSAPGAIRTATVTGADRGGIVWQDTHYRVIGKMLVTVAAGGTTTAIGDVGEGGPVSMAYSFDRLAIASAGKLFYLFEDDLIEVTDPDLGDAFDVIWVDGYFMTTDGTSLVVTELSDPEAVDPLKYGSSEADPDPVIGLTELRGEVFALNRNTIEVFNNRGTTGFPFGRNRGAQIPKGTVGRKAFAKFVETFAFCGSGRNEPPAVYLAGAGQGIKISPPELDADLAKLTVDELATVHVEARTMNGIQELLVHLPTLTWVYGWTASQQLDIPVWYRLAGGKWMDEPYRPRNFTLFGSKCWCGATGAIGYLDDAETMVFGRETGYQFDSALLYNAGAGAIVHDLQLVPLTGRAELSDKPYITMAWTQDGLTYSSEQSAMLGSQGSRDTRPSWRRLGKFRNWRGLRFRGIASAPVAFLRLEAQLEGLAW